jgi:imidazolonepropionase-like amidohydrolase
MFRKAITVTGLKLLMGTDAGAGAHGRSAEEIIYRVQIAGQPARDALAGTTSLNAQSLGLADRAGALAGEAQAGLDAVGAGTATEDHGRPSLAEEGDLTDAIGLARAPDDDQHRRP